jgi:ABC-type uncharacterized transport system auxiliary subunit
VNIPSKPLLVAVLGLTMSLAGCAGPDGNAAPVSGLQQETYQADKPVRIYTDAVFTGQANGALNAIADKIGPYVTAHPDTFSGAYFSTDASKLVVGVAIPSSEAASGLENLANKPDPGRHRVITVDAQWSLSKLDSVKDAVAQKYMRSGKGDIQSVGVNAAVDAVIIGVLRKDGRVLLKDNPTVIEIARLYGDVVMFKETSRISDAPCNSCDPRLGP